MSLAACPFDDSQNIFLLIISKRLLPLLQLPAGDIKILKYYWRGTYSPRNTPRPTRPIQPSFSQSVSQSISPPHGQRTGRDAWQGHQPACSKSTTNLVRLCPNADDDERRPFNPPTNMDLPTRPPPSSSKPWESVTRACGLDCSSSSSPACTWAPTVVVGQLQFMGHMLYKTNLIWNTTVILY